MVFTNQGRMWVWIDPQARTLVLDTSAQGRFDEVVTPPARLCPGPSGYPDQPTGCHEALADDAGAARRLHRRPRN